MSITELPDLSPEIQAEITNPEFAHRRHGRRSTYSDGCHGPLCRWAESSRQRMRNDVRAERNGIEVRTNRRRLLAEEKAAHMQAIIDWQNSQIDDQQALEVAQRELIAKIKHTPTLADLDRLLEMQQQLTA